MIKSDCSNVTCLRLKYKLTSMGGKCNILEQPAKKKKNPHTPKLISRLRTSTSTSSYNKQGWKEIKTDMMTCTRTDKTKGDAFNSTGILTRFHSCLENIILHVLHIYNHGVLF